MIVSRKQCFPIELMVAAVLTFVAGPAFAGDASAPKVAPSPALALQAGMMRYIAHLEMGAQRADVPSTVEIKEDGDAWVVTESANGATGQVVDSARLAKNTLIVLKRSMQQGSAKIEYEIKDGKAVGTMSVNGQVKPIAADLGGDLFADGPGAQAVMAALPLKDGYATEIRNFSIQTGQASVASLAVVGSEQVTVPAGVFDAYKVVATESSGTKTTIWVAKNEHKAVKLAVSAPTGLSVVSELQGEPAIK